MTEQPNQHHSSPRVGLGIFVVRNLPNGTSEMLLLKRAKHLDGGGEYSLPGGKIAAGEKWQIAAKRELFEETGIVCDNFTQHCWYDYFSPNGTHWITLFAVAKCKNPVAFNKEPDKAESMGWWNIDALPRPLFSSILDAIYLKGSSEIIRLSKL